MPAANRTFWQSAAAVAASFFVVAGAFALSGESHAQYAPNDQRAQKKAQPPGKAPTQQMRRGPMGNAAIGPHRMGTRGQMGAPGGPRGQMLGPGGPQGPQGPQVGPNPNPNVRGPGIANRDPRLSTFNQSPNARVGNQAPGSNQGRFGNQSRFGHPRGFTNRDPRLRAVNAATPQMRQTQRFTHRSDMLAFRARLPPFPLPGERNFTGSPPVAETRFVTTEMVCQWGPDITQARIRR